MMEQNLEKFAPITGLVVYKRNQHFYLQVHAIHKHGEQYAWGEGKAFQKEDLQELALSLRNEALSTLNLKGLLPANVLFYQPAISGNKFIWYLPAAQYHLTFTPTLKIKAGKGKFPGLILAVCDKDLYIYAFKGKAKPDGKTPLFHAPFYNVYDDGEVCMGTISESKKRPYLHEEMDRWERRFFGGRFTDSHGDDDHLAKGYTLKSLYKTTMGRNCRAFPEACLAPAEYKTLDVFIKRIMEGGKNA